MSRRELSGLRAVVTGASSGVGRALALALARRGARVLAVARRADRLEQLVADAASASQHASSSLAHLAGDITDSTFRESLWRRVEENWGGLDLLVNNAGIGALGPYLEAGPERLRQIMEVNFFAPAELAREARPLLGRGVPPQGPATRPAILFVGSVLAHVPVPLKAEYCASKSALWGLAGALRREWAPTGVEVLVASPSTIRSEFFERALGDPSLQRSVGAISPEAAAARLLRLIERGGREAVFPLVGRLFVALQRWAPWVVDRITR